jgi:hypothetical protein
MSKDRAGEPPISKSENPASWPDELQPPAKSINPGAFAGADRTDANPDFAAEEKLARG